jgi:hypothetical protein
LILPVNSATHRLHDILEGVQTDISRRGPDLGVHGHGQTLHRRGEHQRPFTSDQRQLDGDQGESGTKDTGCVDDNVLDIRVLDGPSSAADVVVEQDNREERSCQVERPVISL